MLAVSYQVMLVKASDPARNLAEFIAHARQKPGQMNYASIGIGSAPHLAAEMVKSAANIDLVHVPYRGSSAQAMTAMIAGDITMFMNGTASSIPHIKSGALRGLAVTGPHRVADLPDVPTFAEAGLPGVEVVLWFAATVPAGTPQPIAAKLRADLVQAVSDPEFKKALEARSLEVKTMTPEELSAFMERDDEKFRVLIQKLGLKIE
jgi:tripartite-type tricarboxylate transporter receptor subunit TctC